MDVLGFIERDIWGVDPFFNTTGRYSNGIKIDLIEHTDHFQLKADVPGVTTENIRVVYDLKRDTLYIHSDQTTESKKTCDQGIMHFNERNEVSSCRMIPFKHGIVDHSKIEAKHEDGVLQVTLKKYSIDDSNKDNDLISVYIS